MIAPSSSFSRAMPSPRSRPRISYWRDSIFTCAVSVGSGYRGGVSTGSAEDRLTDGVQRPDGAVGAGHEPQDDDDARDFGDDLPPVLLGVGGDDADDQDDGDQGAGGREHHRLDPVEACLLYTSPSPRDGLLSRMPSSA